MIKWLVTFLFICFSVTGVGAQPKLQRIPDSLFIETQFPADPDIPFIYALKSLDVTFEEGEQSIVAVLRYHVRVKIFDASVKEASVVGIPYYFENDIERVSDIEAVTWQSPDERVVLPPDQIRTINVNARYNVKEFTMPAVQDGSVVEYAYTIRRRYIEELPDFYLSHQVPTSRAEVSITYPRYLRYKVVPQNFSGSLQHSKTRVDSSNAPKIFTYPQPEPIIKETWRATEIPAVKEEAYVSSLDDYRSKIKFQLSEFGIPRQALENSWDYVVEEIRRKQDILSKIGANTRAAAIGADIANVFETQEAAQDSIFRYVNAQVNFSGSTSLFSDVRDEAVLSGTPSDQAAINQTLIAMLNGAGIEAYPLLISTRESGQINTSFPSFFEFNGQLVHSKIGDETYFLDASFPHSQPNLIPVNTYNETALMLKPASYEWVDVEPEKSAFSIQVEMQARLQRDGTLSGSVVSRNIGYPSQLIRQQRSEGQMPAQIIKQAVFDGYSDVQLTAPRIQDMYSFDQPVQLKTDFTLPGYATSFSNGLEFRPMVVGYLMSNPFSQAERDLPVTLDAPEKLDLSYRITLPEGYTVEESPPNRTVELPGAMFREQYTVNGQTIAYEFHIDISRKQFSPEVYPRLLNLYERWVNLSNSSWLISR